MLASDFEIVRKRFPVRSGHLGTISLDSEQTSAQQRRYFDSTSNIEISRSPRRRSLRSSECQTGFAFLPSCETAIGTISCRRVPAYRAYLPRPIANWQRGSKTEREKTGRERQRDGKGSRGRDRASCIVTSDPYRAINALSAAIKRARRKGGREGGAAEPPFIYPRILKINN